MSMIAVLMAGVLLLALLAVMFVLLAVALRKKKPVCPHCGKQLEKKFKLCPWCGQAL